MTDQCKIERLASAVLADALIADPFYAAISVDFEGDIVARRAALIDYFHYSLREGYEIGVVTLEAQGAAIWTVPQSTEVTQSAAKAKLTAFATVLGPRGLAHYRAIIDFMEPTAHAVVPEGSWYLSILGVAPSQQGRGLGRAMLEPTLHQADAAQVPCFLETYNAASLRFYNRLGFKAVADHLEPTTQTRYWIMIRAPQPK
ncbi:MAG: GNAT family N-acetyltransferase [Thermoflexales bacterium]|nr:GNAT family N-acetyltransferase [Thermoflexales bacterium]